MYSYLTHRNYLSSSKSYARAHATSSNSDGGTLSKWLRAAYRQWKRNKMVATLEALDDSILRDIGIYRGEIRSIVNGFDDRELSLVPVAATDDARRWQ